MGGTTVTTPDGHVWIVRRRWARRDTALRRYLDRRRAFRRMLWIRRGKRLDLEMVGPTSRSWVADTAVAQEVVVLLCAIVILAATTGLGLLGWFVAARLAPSMPHLGAVLGGLAATTVAVAAGLLVGRPWLVEAEQRGIDPPRRVWRVHGWRRSGRALREVVAAIGQGRLDVEPAGALPENPRSPTPRTAR
jgi:hypothetical protein